MSTLCMSAVFRQSASKGAARLLLLAMADEANDQGLLTAYRRSQRWLAAKANIDVKTVPRAVDVLTELGELVVTRTGAGRESTDYRIELPGIESPHHAGSGSAPRGGSPPSDAGSIIPFSPVPSLPSPYGASSTDSEPGQEPPRDPSSPSSKQALEQQRALPFDEFWRLYPRKVGKPRALLAWKARVAKAGVEPNYVMAGLLWWKIKWTEDKTITAFMPYPATWLNDERWKDALPAPVEVPFDPDDPDQLPDFKDAAACAAWDAAFDIWKLTHPDG